MSVTLDNHIRARFLGADADAGKIVRKAALDILSDSHQRVPVKTGHLKSTGHVNNTGPLSAEISYDANYAIYVEMGTRHMRAQPFLRPAFDRVVPAFLAAMKALVK